MLCIIDAHAHLHPGRPLGRVLEAAHRQVNAIADSRSAPQACGLLLLADTDKARGFDRLLRHIDRNDPPSGWSFRRTEEDCTILAHRPDGPPLIFAAGSQVVTAEKLEVLALMTTATIAQGRTLEETIAAAREAGALPVIPWGFGKWWFGRGRLVQEVVQSSSADVFLADSATRPRGWPQPSAFARGRENGLRILAGSDPLPLPWAAESLCQLASLIEGELDLAKPAHSLRELLSSPVCPPIVGQRIGMRRAMLDQTGLRVLKAAPL